MIDSIHITEPDSLVVDLISQNVRCHSGSDGQLTANISGGSQPYTTQWSTNSLENDTLALNLPAGAYTIQVSDLNNCLDSSSAFITEPDTLVLFLQDVQDAFCSWANGSASVLGIGGTPPYSYTWSSLGDLNSPEALEIFPGAYDVWLTDSLGCQDSISLTVGDTPPAVALFETIPAPSPFVESQNPIQFQNLSTGAVAYIWEFGDGDLSQETSPSHSFPEPGIYQIRLTAYNEFKLCPTDYFLNIEIIPDGSLYFPNAFSPNGDNTNDIFYLKGEGIVSIETIIFDRWGREITRLFALSDGWNGLLPDGTPAPEGVYVFATKAVLNDGRKVDRNGSITLIR